jgi:hypothetical protein
MNLDDILKEWASDCTIEQTQLDKSSRETPTLHAKYLKLLSNAKLQHKRAEQEQYSLLKKKFLYYQGKMDQEAIEKLGWEPDPFDGLKIMKGDMNYYYDADPEIQKSVAKVEYYKTVIDTLKEIVDNLKWRHQTIGNIIKWKVFEAGG